MRAIAGARAAVWLSVLLAAWWALACVGQADSAADLDPEVPAEPLTVAGITARWVDLGPPPQFDAPAQGTPANGDPPLPNIPPAPGAFAYGVASGDMTADGVVLWTRTQQAAVVVPYLSETRDFAQALALTPGRTGPDADFTGRVVLSGLKAATRYYYRFSSARDVSPVGVFVTPPGASDHRPVTVAFSGDVDWRWKPYPLVQALARERMDLFVFLGDLIYEWRNLSASASAESLDDFRFKYRENREPRLGSGLRSPLQELYAVAGQYQVFDNHELAFSAVDQGAPPYTDGGVTLPSGGFVNQSPGYQARVRAYQEYQPVRPETVTGATDARASGTRQFYRSIPWGADLQVLVLDDRSYRDGHLDGSDSPRANRCTRTMLGITQLVWLERELQAAQQRGVTWKLVVASSPMQELGRASEVAADLDGNKSWAGGYTCERDRLLKFIDDNGIDNVVVITTDNHYTVINNLSYHTDPGDPGSPRKPARNAFEVLTGPLGANTGPPPLNAQVAGMAQRDADRRLVDVWNGDAPDDTGRYRGLKQAGLDPIGLEPDFPGLDADSVRAAGVPAGRVEPLAFVSFRSFSYATLAFDQAALTVRVVSAPAVADPRALTTPAGLARYEAQQPAELLRFTVRAQ